MSETPAETSLLAVLPDPPTTPEGLGHTVSDDCPPLQSFFPRKCGLQEVDQSL